MPKKRSNGEGALRKRQNGLWECMIMTGFQPNGKRKYKSFYARTQREVLQKVKDYQTAIDSGLDVTKREPTFAEWAQTWYEGYRDQVSPTTYEGYGYTLKTLNKTFGAMPLRSIKAADVEAFLRELFTGFDVVVTDAAEGARPGLDRAIAQDFIDTLGLSPAPKLGWTDVSRFSALGVPAVNFGPGNPLYAHKSDEHVRVTEVEQATATLRSYLQGR